MLNAARICGPEIYNFLTTKKLENIGAPIRGKLDFRHETRISLSVRRCDLPPTWASLWRSLREAWLMEYRAAILERDPALPLQRIVEAYQAIQRRMARVGNNSNEIPELANAIKVLDGLRNCPVENLASTAYRGRGAIIYLKSGCGVKDAGSSSSTLRTSSGLYSCSSPHSSHRAGKAPLSAGGGETASASPRGILCPNITFVCR